MVQESYLRAYRGLKRFRGDAQFTTWLYRITGQLRRRPTWAGAPATATTSSTTTWPIDDLRPAANPEAVARARPRSATGSRTRCGALPPRLRAVVVLRDVYDLPHEAIAAELGISESAAKVRLHRARRQLREELCPLPGDGRGATDEDARAV